MPRLTIDSISVDAPVASTILEAARLAGISIPTLCYAPEVRPQTSCMICVVEDTKSGRTLPACSAKAEEGMVIETNSDAIRAARREVLQLLLSEHAGDCEAPCRRMCPASMNIPLMLRLIAKGDTEAAARVAAQDLIIPATLGWVCNAPCQKGCRRAVHDETIAIRDLHRKVAEAALETQIPLLTCAPDSGKHVAIVGAGPSGLAAAGVLRQYGHACQVFEKTNQAGGRLRPRCTHETGVKQGLMQAERGTSGDVSVPVLREDADKAQLPARVLDSEINALSELGIKFHYNTEVNKRLLLAELREKYDAVVVTCPGLERGGEDVFVAAQERLVIRAVAAGKKAAEEAHCHLTGGRATPPGKPYDSTLGRLDAEHVAQFVDGRIEPEVLARPQQPEHPEEEAERCFHCDCHAPVSCKLRQYATEYGALLRPFRAAERAPVETVQRHGEVLFEPGKCIRCGLCVEITRAAGEAMGLTFVGRGFDTSVQVPFNESLGTGLKTCARECVEACPTGALTFATQEEQD